MTYLRTISSGREVFSGYATCAFKVMRELHIFNYIRAFLNILFKLQFDYSNQWCDYELKFLILFLQSNL